MNDYQNIEFEIEKCLKAREDSKMNSYDIIENELNRLHGYMSDTGPNRKWAKEKIDEIHIDLFNVGELAQENVELIEEQLGLPEKPEFLN